jgi:translation initiation factor 5
VKKSVINSKCKACGHIYQIDPKQKLSTYIMKNPPVQESASNEAEGKENGGTPPAVDTIDNVDSGFVVDNNHHLSAAGSLEDGEDDDWAPEIEGKAEELSGEVPTNFY